MKFSKCIFKQILLLSVVAYFNVSCNSTDDCLINNDSSGQISYDDSTSLNRSTQAVNIYCGPCSMGWTNPSEYMTWELQISRNSHKYQIGDPEVCFNMSKVDPNYKDQIMKWMKAGCLGGIPHVNKLNPDIILSGSSSSTGINRAISSLGLNGGVILLKNGVHKIYNIIEMKSNVIIIGESRNKTELVISNNMRKKAAINFDANVCFAGVSRLTIKGGFKNKWGKYYPKYLWNIGDKAANDELNLESSNEEGLATIRFYHTKNCWLDDMNILNSADFSIRCFGNNTTFRNLHIEGAYTKCGGGRGYFYIGRPYNLVTGCEVTHIRHISIQTSTSEYNVLINNAFRQEISFHNNDNGNNLIERNNITLPNGMPGTNGPNYYSIMGPWSSKHTLSHHLNFVYHNHCIENNVGHNGNKPWSNDSKLYKGPYYVKPKNPLTNFKQVSYEKNPKYDTLYPVILD